jgi:hypothetical protein
VLRKEGQNALLPLLLLAREGGRGDEYMKYLEVFLHYYYSFPIVIK